jgi:hypothetical protein
MVFRLRALLLCIAISSSACGGGGGSALLPAAGGSAADAPTRTVESSLTGVIFLAYPDHIAVYRKDATGSPAPVRTITGLSNVSGIALDRFGNLYVSDSASWTVREFDPRAHGNASPLHVFTARDRDRSEARHGIVAIGLRWDGGIAALAERVTAASSAVSFGVFEPGDHAFGVVKQFAGMEGRGLTVDGSGNVLLAYGVPGDRLGAVVLERFSPHPYGFHDDGAILKFDLGSPYAWLAIAASPFNALQINDSRFSSSADPVPTYVGPRGDILRAPHLAFDMEGRLISVSIGPNNLPALVAVAPKDVGSQVLHEFQVPLVGPRFFAPLGIAASD